MTRKLFLRRGPALPGGSMSTELPTKGVVFWPVGTGDSTTVLVDDGIVMQVDINHLECAGEESDPHAPIIDDLIDILPEVDGKPYLAVFTLTHPDQDHCRGFARLLDEVIIGEIWFTPRIFREYEKDLSDDACAFREEADRRVAETIRKAGVVNSGDRVRIIGYDDLLDDEEFEGLPEDRLTVPGNAITEIDGEDRSDAFRVFVHAPFKDDSAGERNETSLALQIRLIESDATGHALVLGDLSYPTLKKIFEISEATDLHWNVFLAPHHCSKSVMYWADEGETEETLKQDVLDMIERNAGSPGHVVASSDPIPATNKPGDNPPHAKAKARYEEIAPDGFICTQDHPNPEEPEPIVFALGEDGFEKVSAAGAASAKPAGRSAIAAAVELARGGSEPPRDRVGFGRYR